MKQETKKELIEIIGQINAHQLTEVEEGYTRFVNLRRITERAEKLYTRQIGKEGSFKEKTMIGAALIAGLLPGLFDLICFHLDAHPDQKNPLKEIAADISMMAQFLNGEMKKEYGKSL